MGRAKEIKLKIIKSDVANAFVKKYHYSGKVVNLSNLHFGCFLDDKLHGVMSYGPPMDKRNVLNLVETSNKGINKKWNEMLELNRMAFKLTQINKNGTIYKLANGEIVAKRGDSKYNFNGAKALKGFQNRYIYLIDKNARLNCEELSFTKIDELGAGMYRGEKITLKERKEKMRD